MSTKFMLFVLGTLLLAQCALANVSKKKSDYEEAVTALKSFGNSLLRSSFIVEVYNLTRTILEPAVASVTVTKDVTKTPLQKNIEKLKEYFEKSHNLVDDAENKATFLEGLDKILSDIHDTETKLEDLTAFESSVLRAIENFKTESYKKIVTITTQIRAEELWEEQHVCG